MAASTHTEEIRPKHVVPHEEERDHRQHSFDPRKQPSIRLRTRNLLSPPLLMGDYYFALLLRLCQAFLIGWRILPEAVESESEGVDGTVVVREIVVHRERGVRRVSLLLFINPLVVVLHILLLRLLHQSSMFSTLSFMNKARVLPIFTDLLCFFHDMLLHAF